MEDKSYTPLEADFAEFMVNHWPYGSVPAEQIRQLRNVFFAGASSALGRIRKRPTSEEIMLDELEDYANEQA